MGSEPQICFYANRRSVTGYIYTYGLMETNAPSRRMQKEMIDEIEGGRPEILVMVELRASWLATKESEKTIFHWMEKYSHDFYDTIGVVNFLPSGTSESHWGDDAARFHVGPGDAIYVMKRKLEQK